MHFNALLKRLTPKNVKSIFRYNISSKQLILLRYNGKISSLTNLKEIFHIGGEGRNLNPRGDFLLAHTGPEKMFSPVFGGGDGDGGWAEGGGGGTPLCWVTGRAEGRIISSSKVRKVKRMDKTQKSGNAQTNNL